MRPVFMAGLFGVDMTRRDDLHRKCANLLRAYTRSPDDMHLVWLDKYCRLRNMMKAMPRQALDAQAVSHHAHMDMAIDAIRTPSMGRRVSNGIIGALFGYDSHSANRYI